MIEVKRDPSRTDLVVFGGIFLALFGVLALLAAVKPPALLITGIITLSALVISVAFNREFPVKGQLIGLLLPGLLFGVYGLTRIEALSGQLVWPLCAIGVAGALAIWLWRPVGTWIYVAWMVAVVPMGWTMGHLLLAIVYYLVITPIGLLMRALGKAPLERRLDCSADSYWTPHHPASDRSRYFRQF